MASKRPKKVSCLLPESVSPPDVPVVVAMVRSRGFRSEFRFLELIQIGKMIPGDRELLTEQTPFHKPDGHGFDNRVTFARQILVKLGNCAGGKMGTCSPR